MTQLAAQPELDASPAPKPARLIRMSGRTANVDQNAAEKAFGSSDAAFIEGLVHQLINLGSAAGKKLDEEGTAFVASIVAGIKPQDQLEAMLAAQMAAVHLATMTFARPLAYVDNIPQQDSAERAFNKLARTFEKPPGRRESHAPEPNPESPIGSRDGLIDLCARQRGFPKRPTRPAVRFGQRKCVRPPFGYALARWLRSIARLNRLRARSGRATLAIFLPFYRYAAARP